ncbi:MAG: hypothetical protein HPY62_01110 [Bacteroidales bacterium]|nr:hypothetical protein [Bacteroidales bacterium]
MRSLYTLAITALLSVFSLSAQKPIQVFDDSLQIGNSVIPSISVTIPEVDYEKALKTWIRDLQSGTKSKVMTENKQMTIFGAKIKELNPNPINVYSKLENYEGELLLTAAFEIKKDLYIAKSSGEAEYVKAQNYLKTFSKNLYVDLAKSQADAEEKKLKDLQRELSSLENEKTRLQRSIETNNTTIAQEKENIVVQNNELTIVNAELDQNNSELASMEAGTAQKEKMNLIKELEKRKKKALSSIESSENKISKATAEIEKATNEIPRNEKMQEKVREQIQEQEAVYQKFADKLKTIRSY